MIYFNDVILGPLYFKSILLYRFIQLVQANNKENTKVPHELPFVQEMHLRQKHS